MEYANKRNKNVLIMLLLIVLLGSVLRFSGLSQQSLWLDELYSWKSANFNSLSQVIEYGKRDIHPPGYAIVLYYIEKFIGDSETALRLPSAICGVLSIIVIYFLGLRYYSYKESLISSALMAFLWCPVYYSQEARMYSMMLLFTLTTMYCWDIVFYQLQTNEKLTNWYAALGYIISSIILCYLHYFGTFLIALLGITSIVSCVKKRKALLMLLLIHLPIAIAYAPWISVMLSHAHKSAYYIHNLGIYTPIVFLKFFFNSYYLLLIILLFYAFYFFSIIRDIGRKHESITELKTLLRSDIFLIAWLIIPFLGTIMISVLLTPVTQNRNLIILLPPAYLLFARSITQLTLSTKKQMIISFLIIGIFLCDLIFIKDYYSRPTKQQYREAVKYIIHHDHVNDPTLIIGLCFDEDNLILPERAWVDNLNYYFLKNGSQRRVSWNPINSIFTGGLANEQSKLLQEINTNKIRYVWFVNDTQMNPEPYIAFMEQHLTLLEKKSFIGIDVRRFENTKS